MSQATAVEEVAGTNPAVVAAPELLSTGKATMGANTVVPFSSLWQDDADNTSREFSPMTDKEIRELGDEIIEYGGLMSPILVRELTEQEAADRPKGAEWKVIAGHGRYKAIALLISEKTLPFSKDAVPVQISQIEGGVQYASMDANLRENLKRVDTDPIAIGKALIKIQVLTAEKLSDIAKRYGKTASWASQHMGMAKLPNDICKKISSGVIPKKLARVLHTLESDDMYKRVAAIEAGVSTADVVADAIEGRGKKYKNKGRKKKGDTAVGAAAISSKQAMLQIATAIEEYDGLDKLTTNQIWVKGALAKFDKFLSGKLSIKLMKKQLEEL